jgi:microcystin-dependent protein
MAQDSQNFIPVAPDLNAWMRLMLQTFSANLNCCSLATVNSFNASNQTVNLTINYVRVLKNANPNLPNPAPDGQVSNVYLPYPVLIQCPVYILQGGGAYITMPIAKGDTGLVLFNDRELSTWMQTGQVVAPQNQRTHDLSDGIYFGGIRNLLNFITNYNTSVVSVTDKTGERLNQSGMMVAYGGAVAPTGWLLCQGQSLKRTDYPLLFAAIGTIYGSADGTHFNLPDGRANTLVGYKSGDPYFGTLGSMVGAETVTLTLGNLPSGYYFGQMTGITQAGSSFGLTTWDGVQGSSTPFSIIQPSLVANWIIKI